MWLVNAALRRPYVVWVGMLLVALLGLVSYNETPTDILPNLKVPVVVVFASYRGMPAPDMEQSVTAVLERALTRCDYLEHIESRSLLGIGIIKVYFRPRVDPDVAQNQVAALVQGEMQNLPPGMLFPAIFKYDASAIPVGQLVISSRSRDDKYLLDLADHQLRDWLASADIEGLASAPVFGGVFRQVQIYVDPMKLEAHNLAPEAVAKIVNTQSQVIPTGEARFGPQTYYVNSNSMVQTPEDFERIPIQVRGRRIVHLGDVATVVDGERWRTNTVLADGRRAVYMPLLRQAGASAVKVVDGVIDFLPQLYKRGLPHDVRVEVAFDQAQYVRDALGNLRLEAVLGAVLASLVVLLFLGSLRSSFIVALSIPLSILAAFIGLYFTGHTLNIMTLGGIALVLGRVVDDSIVDVENTVRHLNLGKSPLDAARDSAEEISIPVLMATVTTVVVFFPLTFMTGVGKYLFTPLAVSAAMAMFASYVVSRTVSPLYCSRYLRRHDDNHRERFPALLYVAGGLAAVVGLGFPLLSYWVPRELNLPAGVQEALAWPYLKLPGLAQKGLTALGAVGLVVVLVGVLFKASPAFQRLFARFTAWYEGALRFCLRRRLAVLGVLAACTVPAVLCFLGTGQELFPDVDSSEFTIHLRATGGPRVEETEYQVHDIEKLVREIIPPEDLDMIVSNIGISSRWSAVYTPNNGPHAAFIRVQLRSGFDGRHTPTAEYVERLRTRLTRTYPGDDFFFETGGMMRQILNAGAVAPIEVQIHSRDDVLRRDLARKLDRRIGRIPQVKDTYMPQGMNLPQLRVNVDRDQAQLLGFTETDVIRNVITALMSSAQLAPNFWIDPATGNPYIIGAQYPQEQVVDLHTLEGIPISPDRPRRDGMAAKIRLDQVARIERTQGPVEVYHHDIDRVSQIFVSVGDQDLAGVAAEVERIVHEFPLKYALGLLPADKRGLANDADFRDRLEAFLQDPQKPEQRHARRLDIREKYGVDPTKLRLPTGVRFTVRGEIQSMRDSFKQMTFSLVLAVLLVYLIMAGQFGSWLDPLIMIVAAPLGLVGVAGILWLTGTSLNIQSFMGVLMMVGISVSNSVLVVEFANRQRQAGLDTLSAIVTAARIRLQPILMTTLATIVGLTPMAIHLHNGDEMNLPLARAVIGGLAGSTLLTLFVVPVLYVVLKPRQRAAVN
jgi:multidrug efflux pump subunit AcrB